MKLSVISPTYNCSKDLKIVLDSLFEQKLFGIQNDFGNLKISFLEIKNPKYENFEMSLSKETFFRIDAPYIFSNIEICLNYMMLIYEIIGYE